MNLTFNRSRLSDEHLRLAVCGEIDAITCDHLDAEIRASLSTPKVTWLSVDLAQVTFMDSAGIRVLVLAHQNAQVQGITLSVDNAQRNVRRVLEITGVLDLLLAP